MLKLIFYVPKAHLDGVLEAVFDAGGGSIGPYKQCAWMTEGIGQFMPIEGALPTVGKVGELSRIEEYRVEVLLTDAVVESCLAAMQLAHPYESPAWEVVRLEMSA